MTCICSDVDNSKFDAILNRELNLHIDIDAILNKSRCVSIDLDIDEDFIDLIPNKNDILSLFENKVGIYHLWIELESCIDHDSKKMLCVYVGKGYLKNRIKAHIKNKWAKDETLYISFYECENRISKYLEQLFLDTYKFHLNTQENNGTESLYTIWDDHRYRYGTDFDDHVDIMTKKNPDLYCP